MSEQTWLGIDLGGTYIKWELVADDGTSLRSGRTPTPRTGQIAVTDAMVNIVDELGVAGVRPAAVGIAVPGHLSAARDSITILPNVPGDWVGFGVRSYIAERTGLDISLLNDARAFALAELELGAAVGASTAVFATIGTGIGGAVAVDGRIVTSDRDTFGEIGHTTAVVDGEACACGGRGCVEAYAGGSKVLERAARRGVSIELGPDALTSLEFAARTDQAAADVLAEAYDAFAVGISTVCAFTGSTLVILGGAVVAELPGYLDRSRQRLEQRRALLGPVEVRAGSLGARAGAVGAARAARRNQSESKNVTSHPELEHQR